MTFTLQEDEIPALVRGIIKTFLCTLAISALLARPVLAQGPTPLHTPTATALAVLLAEAERNNPQIQAARQGWQAAKQVPSQVSALPDPQVQVQQLNVGSPRPFAGYTNSNFAYIGLGASQDLPYPGKLRLRGEVAQRDADIAANRSDSMREAVLAEIKAAYFQLGNLSQTLTILESDGHLLKQIEQVAEARYRSGIGTQQDVLQAQVEQTKLLRDVSMHKLEVGKMEARLKQLVNRPQSSPDIEPFPVTETPLTASFDEILAAAQAQNPDIAGTMSMIKRDELQVDVAHKDFKPDFNVQFMWERTDPEQFRAYYEMTFGMKIPLHYAKQRSELAQAQSELERSRSEYEAQSQQVASELRQQYLIVQQTAELLRIYREGLMPQSRTGFQAGLAAYRNNRQDFQAVLNSYRDVLRLEEENWQNVAEHETAIARLEQMTREVLRPTDELKESQP